MTLSSTPTEPERSQPRRLGRVDTPSWAPTPGVARPIRANMHRDTKPEPAIRRLLHTRGLRYHVDMTPWSNKRRRVDIVFTRRRLAVFIDGCFWHGCLGHAMVSVTNVDYWRPKLARNIGRDRETTAMAEARGWTMLRIWEHVPPEETVRLIVRALDEDEESNGRP